MARLDRIYERTAAEVPVALRAESRWLPKRL